MMKKKENYINPREAKKGMYYRFHYSDGYIVALSEGGTDCGLGVRSDEFMSGSSNCFWANYDRPQFTAAKWAEPAPEEEIQWVNHIEKTGQFIYFKNFVETFHPVSQEKSNYSIF